MDALGAESRAPAGGPGCAWYLLLSALGVYGGTAWTVRSWADCPLGNDKSNNIGLRMMTPLVWLCLTSLVFLLQLPLRTRRVRGGWAALWLSPVVTVVVLTLVYRLGMGWPRRPTDGPCTEGYPIFPFTGVTGPRSAE
ncbi:hypothetical protein [Streptomyces sp. NPDC048643]|uniref:hypothetical protein n=1 Tax=Streptomyces sp. NPDC048643 TaxID=3155637 RepID=UPI003426389B